MDVRIKGQGLSSSNIPGIYDALVLSPTSPLLLALEILPFPEEPELHQDRILRSILAHAALVIFGEMSIDARSVVHPINEMLRNIEIHIELSRMKCTASLDMFSARTTDFPHVTSLVAIIDIDGDISA